VIGSIKSHVIAMVGVNRVSKLASREAIPTVIAWSASSVCLKAIASSNVVAMMLFKRRRV